MPNGRGTLECSYCEWYRCHNPEWSSYPDAAHEAGTCLRHAAMIPESISSGLNRVCRDFRANGDFARHSPVSAEERMADFPSPLAAGVLYGFSYHRPQDVRPIGTLDRDPTCDGVPRAAGPGGAADTGGVGGRS